MGPVLIIPGIGDAMRVRARTLNSFLFFYPSSSPRLRRSFLALAAGATRTASDRITWIEKEREPVDQEWGGREWDPSRPR